MRYGACLVALGFCLAACGGSSGGGKGAPPRIQFEVETFQVDESVGMASIAVVRGGSSKGAVSVDYATSDGTAIEPGDYRVASGSLAWVDGESGRKEFTVPVVNDVQLEGVETIQLVLTNITGGVLGRRDSAVVEIADDDTPQGTIQFETDAYTVTEPSGAVSVVVERLGGSTGGVTIGFTTVPGTAVTPSDFLPLSGTLTWGDGDASGRLLMPTILDDAQGEPDEEFTLTLSNPTGGVRLGSISTSTITIIDDDNGPPGAFRFNASTYPVAEGVGLAVVTVQRVGGEMGQVWVEYSTADGTAISPDDYASTSGVLLWNHHETVDKIFTVLIVDDVLEEGDEDIALTLSNPQGGATLGTPSTATLTVVDDDSPAGSLRFDRGDDWEDEGAGSATFTVKRIGGTGGDVSVTYTSSDGTATSPDDYVAITGTLDWLSGDGTDKTFTLDIVDDGVHEGVETLQVDLSNPTNGATLGTPSSTTLRIYDNDCPGTAPGDLEPSFGTGGFIEENLTLDWDELRCVAVVPPYMYLAGHVGYYEQWRIERRNLADGALDLAWGTGGFVESEQSLDQEVLWSMAANATHLYIVGDMAWRVEKRDMSDGSLDPNFGTGGIAWSPDGGMPYDIAIDESFAYIVGLDELPGDSQFRIEKRSLLDGSLIPTFGVGGVVQENVSPDDDELAAVAVDSTYVYTLGSSFGTTAEMRYEKRFATDGTLEPAFGMGGYVPVSGVGWSSADQIRIDDTHIYAVRGGWVDKRSILDGLLEPSFGTGGSFRPPPSVTALRLLPPFLYVGGFGNPPDRNWWIEKRYMSDASFDVTFGTAGVATTNPTLEDDRTYDIGFDSCSVYQVGKVYGLDYRWRVEKKAQ